MKRSRKWAGAVAMTAIGGVAPSHASPARSKAEAELQSMDKNGDGKISPEEHAAGAKHMFETMDANKDGKVTPAEMDQARVRITGSKAAPDELSSAEKIKAIDTDGDGIITAVEHAAGSEKMFPKMDANKDGFVTLQELAAAHEKMMTRKPGR